MMSDKDAQSVLELLEPRISDIVITQAATPRALPAPELGELATQVFGPGRVVVRPNLPDAIDEAVRLADESGPGAGIFLAGSVALAGQARSMLYRNRPD
jgi:dihydrofolate synthase/folylpolyglutamate synthase